MVWDKVVCDKCCVTTVSCVWKMTKLQSCVEDGVWQSWCVEDVCERWCVTKLCVKDDMWQNCIERCKGGGGGAGGGGGGGIQNQKQELNTKMWGKKHPQNETMLFSQEFPHFFETIWVSNIRERGIPTFEAPPAARCDSHNRPWSGGWASRSYISHIKSNIYRYE